MSTVSTRIDAGARIDNVGRPLRFARVGILTVYAVVIAVPLLVVFLGAFKTTPELFASPLGLPSSLNLDNYTTAFTEQDLGGALLNSIVVVAVSVTSTLVLASLCAYGLARITNWIGLAVYGLIVVGMAVPAQANMIPQYVLLQSLGLLNSLFGLMLILVVSTLPVAVFILTGFMKTLPKELFEAATVDGAGTWRTFWSVVLPMSTPSLAATTIFLFVMHWNDLLYPLLLIQSQDKRTLPLALLAFQGEFQTNYPLLFAGVVMASIPTVIAYVALQRYFVAGMTAGAVKG